MIHKRIKLFEDKEVYLTTYIHDNFGAYGTENGRGAIIVLPGGAFAFLAPNEGEPVAVTFLQKGFNTFVLEYTVGDDCKYPDVLIECSKAIQVVRDNAESWNIDLHRIALMGFSAGACLAGVSATQWNAPEFVNPGASQFPKSCPPQLDMIHYVGEHVCPLFVWHNQKDRYVPVRNALMIAEKMCELKIPVELHLYTGGEHGMSVANELSYRNKEEMRLSRENPNISLWVDMAANWLKSLSV